MIHQQFKPTNDNKMAFIARNVGWYRKVRIVVAVLLAVLEVVVVVKRLLC